MYGSHKLAKKLPDNLYGEQKWETKNENLLEGELTLVSEVHSDILTVLKLNSHENTLLTLCPLDTWVLPAEKNRDKC